MIILAALLGELQPPRKAAQAACRGQPTIFCTPGKTVQDSEECGSQTQQLLLKKLRELNLTTWDQLQCATPQSHSLSHHNLTIMLWYFFYVSYSISNQISAASFTAQLLAFCICKLSTHNDLYFFIILNQQWQCEPEATSGTLNELSARGEKQQPSGQQESWNCACCLGWFIRICSVDCFWLLPCELR